MRRAGNLLIALLYVLSLTAAAFAGSDPVADLEQLDTLLDDRKPLVGDLLAYVDVVRDAHVEAEGEPDEVAALRGDVESALLRALGAVRLKPAPRGQQTENLLESVNAAAANAIQAIAPKLDAKSKKAMRKRIAKVVDELHDAKRYKPSQERIDATFRALAAVGDERTLGRLLDDYSHTKANEMPFLVAAHQAMLRFDDVPGKLRHAIVKRFIERYAGLESSAERSANDPTAVAAKRLWDDIRVHTIAVLQKFAGFPVDAQGNALARVEAFQGWFRDHKSPRKAPWKEDV